MIIISRISIREACLTELNLSDKFNHHKAKEQTLSRLTTAQLFDTVETILMRRQELLVPYFDTSFKLAVFSGDIGAGAVLKQEDNNEAQLPSSRLLF